MQTPHDHLFQQVFQHPMLAAAWLRSVLPARIVRAIDWTTLTPANARVTGLRLRSHTADLVFTARLVANGQLVLVVIEHKSSRDSGLDSQLLRYVVHLRRLARRHNTTTEPLVVTAVLHHGDVPFDRSVSVLATALQGLDRATADDFAAMQPQLAFPVDDLCSRTEADIRTANLPPLVQLCLLCLRLLPQASVEQALAAIDRWGDLLRAVEDADGPPLPPDAIDDIGWYVLDVTDVTEEQLHMAFTNNLNQPQGTRMTTGQRIRNESRQQGLNQGLSQGQAKTLLRQLTKRFGELPVEIAQRVAAASSTNLDLWTDRILDATSLAAVFAED